MSNILPQTQPPQPSNATASTATSTPPSASNSQGTPVSRSAYTVPPIPAFKGARNYASAAATGAATNSNKARPSAPALSTAAGRDLQASLISQSSSQATSSATLAPVASSIAPSQPTVAGADSTLVGAGQPRTSTTSSHARNQSVKFDSAINVAPSGVQAIRGANAAAGKLAFGNVNDAHATLSSSPAAPPAFHFQAPSQPTFGTLGTGAVPASLPSSPAPSTSAISPSVSPAPSSAASPQPPAKKLDMHSFFMSSPATSTNSSSPRPFQPPQPQQPGLGSQLSSSSLSFAPRAPSFTPQNSQPFVPQQQLGGFPSQGPHLSTSNSNQNSSNSFHKSPNAITPFSPAPVPSPIPQQPNQQQRNGSFVGSPSMQHRVPQGGNQGRGPPPQQQHNQGYGGPQQQQQGGGAQGPTSPRLVNMQIGGGAQFPSFVPQQQQWAPYTAYPPPVPYYYPQGGSPYAPPVPTPGPPSSGPPPSTNTNGTATPVSGSSTPSRPPPSLSSTPFTPNPNAPSYSASPVPQSATLPHHPHPHSFTNHHPSASLGGVPRPGTFSLGAAEFRPTSFGPAPPSPAASEPPAFTPAPRKSAAIRIRDPKVEGIPAPKKGAKKEEDEAAAVAATKKKSDEEEEKKKKDAEEEEAKKKAAEAEAKEKEEEEKAEVERIKKEEEEEEKAAEAAKIAAEKAEKEEEERLATEKKDEEDRLAKAKAAEEEGKKAAAEEAQKHPDALAASVAADSAPSTPGQGVAGLNIKSSQVHALRQEEVALLADEKVAVDNQDPAQALVEARETIPGAPVPTPTASPLPSFLPSKPVNGATSPETDKSKRVPGPLDLSSAKSDNVAPALPSALASARIIDNLSSISYPSGIKSPRPELNAGAEPGKYRYDREFLMQFMAVCLEKPESLPNLEQIGMVDAGADVGGTGGARLYAPGRRPSMGPPGVVPGRAASAGGFSRQGGPGANAMGQFPMGSFGSAGVPSTSDDRFKAANARAVSTGGFGATPQQGGRMARVPSQGGAPTSFGPPQGRAPSMRGKQRDAPGGGGRGGGGGKPGQHVSGEGFEDAKLVATENRWMPTKIGGASNDTDNSVQTVQRKVKALLNKLTLEKFDSISSQILEWANKSADETDGRILRQVIALIFEKATDEANWSEMYARLCRKLMEVISPDVKDQSVKGTDGTPVAGGALFRKYLLNRCQEDYESGWKQKEVSAAAAAGKAADDHAKKEANEAATAAAKEAEEQGASSSSSSAPKEAELLSDEYYAAQKAKRRGLGLVRFIGELYRLSMLTERIMHECIKKLLANTENPEEEDIESLCRLLTTVGQGLDNVKAKNHMDIYFSRMKTIADNMKISSRIRFMIQDVLELREDRWQPRNVAAGPKMISEIHADAQKASEEASRRVASSSGKGLPRLADQLSRPNSRRGQGREQFGVPAPGADGWSAPVPQRPAKAGDLSSFGKIRDSSATISLGPSGAFANARAAANKAKETPRPAPSNPFALLGGDGGDAPATARPKLVLAPRTKPLEVEGAEEEEKHEEEPVEGEEEEEEDDGQIDPNAVSMPRAEAERRAANSVKEYFSVKNLSEGVASVEALPVEYRALLITAFANEAILKKASDVSLVRQLFAEVIAKTVISQPLLVDALKPTFATIVDQAVDAPKAYEYLAQLVYSVGATKEEVEKLSELMVSEDEDDEAVEKGHALVMQAFEKL